ncbi:anti-sigma factor family protein [Couchioplanes azureus]|uniref:anti-sigma factor family protein n=1 Tax=Couchioplanes caeruleus TaxID=56438 RepID=UPI00166FDBB2|nr:zf-HC2 domain-containing protein [Couchioplanes caeruleus]GGQ56672.1 membrane protein [Couchioplanes caeruleus subsp. azureus]
MTQEQHFDVAAYALGVLDERDAARFEDHLIDCPACAIELESLLPVVDILSDVDADALVATEQSRRDGLMLKSMIGEVKRERRRANSRRLYSLAAAVVVFAMLSIGALFAGGQWFAPEQQPTQPSAQKAQPRSSKQLDPLPLPDGGIGIGGTPLAGETYSSTDARTGVKASVGLEPKDWGTQVSYAVANIKGPLVCRAVAVRTNGASEVLSTWNVGEKGWGTAAQPEPLLLQSVTALARADIAHIQVQALDAKGTWETLVRVP